MVGNSFLDNTYNAIMLVSDFPVKDLYTITNVHFKDDRVDGTGTSVVSARVAGSASFENVDARNVGAVGVNNCGSFHFTPAGSEFTLIDLGSNDGGGTTGPWLAPWELPNTITGWPRGNCPILLLATTVHRSFHHHRLLPGLRPCSTRWKDVLFNPDCPRLLRTLRRTAVWIGVSGGLM